jgi:hypothetical protein
MKLHHDFSNLHLIIDDLNQNKKLIGEMWIKRERLKDVLEPNDIKIEFFLKYFGNKIINYNFGVIDKGNEAGNCPVVHIMLDYFENKDITIMDIYLICAEFKNVLLLYYMKNFSHLDDVVYYELVDLLDMNFSGLIEEYFLTKCKNFKKTFQGNVKIEDYLEQSCATIQAGISSISNDREKDLRFTQHDKISASDFLETLDNTIIDKVEIMTEKSDNFVTTLYDLEECKNGADAMELIPSIQESLGDVFELVSSLVIFDVTARAFDNLSKFLFTIEEEMLEDQEKKALLATMLLAIANDFEKWMRVVFIEQSTMDVHYFDASFSSNILEIENIFLVDDDYDEDGDDDLEFF